ncbi:MAG: hypothetical protein ACM3ND_04290, partial [Acidobacteriota bacterium]
ASGNGVGGQFAIEQPMTGRFTLAADWYTGDQALGYVTPGIIFKMTAQPTLYGTFQVGNRRALAGNHQMLVEFGRNFPCDPGRVPGLATACFVGSILRTAKIFP